MEEIVPPKTELERFLEKLPAGLRPTAQRYIEAMADHSFGALEEIANNAVSGKWQAAYGTIVCQMSVADLVSELDRVNSELKARNYQNATFIEAQKAAVRDVVLLGLAALKAKAVG
jgi:hypothetical protein